MFPSRGSNRREFLQRVAISGTGLALTSREASAQTVWGPGIGGPMPDALGSVINWADSCYTEAAISDSSAKSHFTGVGYVHNAVFGSFADAANLLQARIDSFGMMDDIAAATSSGPDDLVTVPQVWLSWIGNQARMPLKKDFFELVPMGDIAVTMPRRPGYDGQALRDDFATIIQTLQQYATGNFYARNQNGKPHLAYARFQSSDPDNKLTALATAMSLTGLGCIKAGGGVGVLSGTVSAGVAGNVLAWGGAALLALGIGFMFYVGYRVLTQKEGYSRTPWLADPPVDGITKPTIPKQPLYPPLMPPDVPAVAQVTSTWRPV